MSVAEHLKQVMESLPLHVTLVAVSKTHPQEAIAEAYNCGQRHFAENKVQELLQKVDSLPRDIQWHMIGHLQTNKVKFVVPFVALIHSVDSLKLLETIDKEAGKIGRVVDCLLQVHIAMEDTKFGFGVDDLPKALPPTLLEQLKWVRIRGLMGMASFIDDEVVVRQEFARLKQLFDLLKSTIFVGDNSFDTLSMGMSDDFRWAITEGSNMVRVGNSIFGARDYGNAL